jgi:lipopolysaccharide assembly outer membrane protein LptD (OstA)
VNKKKLFTFLLFFSLITQFNNPVYALEDQLFMDTLSLDVETANYYELENWAIKLGLSSNGSIDELRNRIYAYYEYKPISKDLEKESGRSIIIESARELNYIDDLTINQNYIILHGEVILKMIDSDNQSIHEIKADKIIFNQTEKTISALGNIDYKINRSGEDEFFHGESLVFEVETWQGIFFEGVSEKNRLIENKDLSSSENVPFFFSGENIYRGANDKISLSKGSITSSKNDDPYYRIDADKIWVLGPGEWAIKNAALYVGRIPLFYLPFMFLPGDELIVNPSLGYKTIEGYFINTTTYLIGIKDNSSSDTFSFLQTNDSTSILKAKERNGFFLETTERDLNTDIWPYKNGSNLKLLVDYYTRKGIFIGLDGSLNFDSFIKNIDLFSGISFSRYLYQEILSSQYTPFRVDSNGNYISDYEESYVFGNILPFRFAVDFSMLINTNWANLDIDLPMYSDSKFRSDFLNREEGLKWTEIFDTQENDNSPAEPELSTLSLSIIGSLHPSAPNLKPFIENLSFNKINTKFNFQSAVLNKSYNQLLIDNNYKSEDLLSFYYPSSLILPEVSGIISGIIFKSKNKNDVTGNSEGTRVIESELLLEPWDKNIRGDGVISSGLLKDPLKQDYIPLKIKKESTVFTNTLKYSISPSLSLNSIFSSVAPTQVEDISYLTDYSIFSAQTTALLDYSFHIYDSMISLNNLTIFSLNYKEHINSNIETDVWESYLLQDKTATNYKLTDTLKISTKPFINYDLIKDSSFSYNLGTTLYNKYFNSTSTAFEEKYPVWDKESINSHRATINLKLFDSVNNQIFKIETVLPPDNIEIYPDLTLSSTIITGNLKTGFKFLENDNSWINEPYESFIKLKFLEKDYLKQTISIDVEDKQSNFSRTELFISKYNSNLIFTHIMDIELDKWLIKKSSTNLQLWFLNFSFLAEDINGYSFALPLGWIPASESGFKPSRASASVKYTYSPDPFWKNRVDFSFGINSSWTMNLQKYTDTAFIFDLKLNLEIAEFLKLSFSSSSVNRATYRYIPGFSGNLGLDDLNIIRDLIKSFNFFDKKDRIESNFNLESLNVSATHHLRDWDLSFEYSGLPVLITNNDNSKEYQMKTEFKIFLTWKPVPEIKKNINYSDNEIDFE